MKPQINLYEAGLLPRPVRPPLAAWLAVLAAMCVVTGWRIADASRELHAALAQAEPIDEYDVQAEPADLVALRAEVASAEAVAGSVSGRDAARWDPLALSVDLIAALPPSLWLQHLVVDAKGSVAVAGAATRAADIERYAVAITGIPALRATPVHAMDAGDDADADDGTEGADRVASTRFSWTIGEPAGESWQER